MSDESRFDCQCKCPECVEARTTIRNLKRRMKRAREMLRPWLKNPAMAAADDMLDLRSPKRTHERNTYEREDI